MNKIIGPYQTSFLKNMQEFDNAIIVQETIHHFQRIKGEMKSVIMKVDLEKAFDKLEYSFVKHTLEYFNFPKTLSCPAYVLAPYPS